MKLKKLLIAILAITAAISCALYAGCATEDSSSSDSQTATVSSITYKSGLNETYYQNTKINLVKLTITAEYSDKTKKDVVYGDEGLTVTGAETTTLGNVVITISYGGKQTQKTVNILENKYTVTTFDYPAFATEYASNIKEQDNKETQYIDRTQGYFVGDDNAFVFLPKYQAVDSGMNLVNMNDKEKLVVLYKWNGTAYVELTGSEIADNVAIDPVKCTFDFTDAAIGNKYKIKICPKNLSETQSIDKYTCEIEVNVVDGYNCYSAAELSLFDNRYAFNQNDGAAVAWKNWREAHNITVDPKTISALIIHGDITITRDDLPSVFFYNEGDSDVLSSHADYGSYDTDKKVIGSLRDWSDVYVRDFDKEGEFSMIGNYFKIDASKIPLIIRSLDDDGNPKPSGNVIVSHAKLFRYENLTPEDTDTCNGTIKNISAVGNVNRTESKYTGGLIFYIANYTQASVYNVIARSWYITAFSQLNYERNPVVIEKCKFYDDYSNIIYSWGGYTKIVDSEMVGAGGPVIIADHVSPKDAGGGHISQTVIVNSKLESWVTGLEGWFNNMGATSAATQLINLDAIFRNFGKTYVKKQGDSSFINLIILIKSGDAEAMTYDKISGTVNVDNEHTLNFDDQFTAGMLYNPTLLGTGAPAFQGAIASGICAFNGSSLLGYNSAFNGVEAVTSPSHALFNGNYLNIFVSGPGGAGYMGIVLGGYTNYVAA